MDCQEISRNFVNYYESQGFRFIPPAPMLQKNLPMSYVYSCTPPEPDSDPENPNYMGNKFVRHQTCFRHFDVDAVGKDNQHLSLFEMSGAFHFGQSSREKTISRIWHWATQEMGIDPERIWISYFGGGKIPFARDFRTGECVTYLEIAEDRETLLAWRKAGFPQNRLIPLDAEHNFWMEKPKKKNISLKCGPTSELFYDLGEDKTCGRNCIPGCGCGRFIEFSNNRFITHRLNPRKGNLEKVKNALAETVIGIERISMITGNVPSIWDTPSCQPLIKKIHEFVTCENEDEAFIRESESVIADHLKALCVLIADGAPAPGRSGRARIVRTLIRKILTRMMLLGIDAEKFFPVIISAVMPEAANQKSLKEKMTAYLENESEVFRNTLKKGSNELEKMISGNQGKSLSASQTFFLKEYRGMPVLLTKKCRVT